jgi:hypothetical protein
VRSLLQNPTVAAILGSATEAVLSLLG